VEGNAMKQMKLALDEAPLDIVQALTATQISENVIHLMAALLIAALRESKEVGDERTIVQP
jgi:hypothetical protein